MVLVNEMNTCIWFLQVSGEAQYVDDIPLPANALHAAFVLSTRPHANILSVDYSTATQVRMKAIVSCLETSSL